MGSGPHLVAARWLLRAGIDPRDLDWSPMNYPEVYAAMQNQGIEVGFSTEPLVTAGIERGIHHILATQEEMYSTTSRLYLLYSSSIERLGKNGTPMAAAWLSPTSTLVVEMVNLPPRSMASRALTARFKRI